MFRNNPKQFWGFWLFTMEQVSVGHSPKEATKSSSTEVKETKKRWLWVFGWMLSRATFSSRACSIDSQCYIPHPMISMAPISLALFELHNRYHVVQHPDFASNWQIPFLALRHTCTRHVTDCIMSLAVWPLLHPTQTILGASPHHALFFSPLFFPCFLFWVLQFSNQWGFFFNFSK